MSDWARAMWCLQTRDPCSISSSSLGGSYVPDRTFTNPSLSSDFIHKPETSRVGLGEIPALLFEFPGDLHGISVDAQDGERPLRRYLGAWVARNRTCPRASAAGGTHWHSPFSSRFRPGLRFDFAALYDTHGGILVQPAIRWKPSGGITVETFYNYLNSHLAAQQRQQQHHRELDFASEVGVRLGYQF